MDDPKLIKIKCKDNELKCPFSGWCLPVSKLCDGVADCVSQYDELLSTCSEYG